MSESIEEKARWTITGAVVRKWVANSGKFATATIEVGGPRVRKIKVRGFREVVEEFGKLGEGEVITLVGEIEPSGLTNKAKEYVKVDGYGVDMNELTVTSIKRYDTNRTVEPPRTKKENPPPPGSDDDIPF
jgi:hypothetical protein